MADNAMTDWDPALYQRFAAQRLQPFTDLLGLLPPRIEGRMIDLGCGHGVPTRIAAEQLGVTEVVGLDSSASMLEKARAELPEATWRLGNIERFVDEDPGGWDLVLANAALHWVPDHAKLWPRLMDKVAHGGWLAVQMPMNHTAPTHVAMAQVARDLGVTVEVYWPQREPAFYEVAMHAFTHAVVELRTYRHAVPGPESIANWTRSTGMRPYLAAVDDTEAFLAAYIQRMDAAYPPCDAQGTRLLDYRRILIVGRRP